ncbi:hypothetical protein PG2006B_0267 [Bifidobacterium animalis subsp. animalis]|nr:hypothetical protein PG2006B_0267 [Bifidobacterium animalis subsp. animalis]
MTRDSKETMRHGERRKFTQTTRSLPARTASAKIRLVSALISVITLLATMFVTGPFQARVAEAAGEGGVCQGVQIPTIGSADNNHRDSGIATWVGRDMYVGKPKDGVSEYGPGTTLVPSYATEAEGLTAVDGKLAINTIKGEGVWRSWQSHGFRFGVVGFGAMYTPVAGSDVLVVGGNNSAVTLKDGDGNPANATGWGYTGRGIVRGDNYGPAQNARIKVGSSGQSVPVIAQLGSNGQEIIDRWDNNQGQNVKGLSLDNEKDYVDGYNKYYDSDNLIYAYDSPQSWQPHEGDSYVNWDASANVMTNVQVNHAYVDGQNTASDISGTTNRIQKMSANFAKLAGIPAQSGSAASQQGFVRQLYNNSNHRITMNFTDSSEKLITFSGDGTNQTQVFDLPASYLQDGSANGISFKFENIPTDAVVVVNVTGANNQPIEFHNGWRFWWRGEEISNYYYEYDKEASPEIQEQQKKDTGAKRQKYSDAAASILWNFVDASDVVIYGGQITGDQNAYLTGPKVSGSVGDDVVTDDPVANWIGSILVPKGSLETHVSTNGRVWVGDDYMMHNPIGLHDYKDNNPDGDPQKGVTSASIIGQDQERHNFPFRGEHSTQCATISWKKVTDDGEGTPLAGTTWGIYKSKDDAIHAIDQKREAIYTVRDNQTNDMSPIGGEFTVRNLNPNANYYIREIETSGKYMRNDNIYMIHTDGGQEVMDEESSIFKEITKVYGKEDGYANNIINDSLKNLLYTFTNADALIKQGIVNRAYPNIEWKKVNKENADKLLPDSRWSLSRKADANTQDYTDIVRPELLDFTESVDENDTLVYLEQPSTGWPSDSRTEPSISYCAYLPTSNTAETCKDESGNKRWLSKSMTSLGSGIWVAVINTDRSNQDASQRKKLSFSFFASGNGNYHATGTSGNTPFVVEPETKFATVYKLDNKPAVRNEQPAYVDTNPILGQFDIKYLEPGAYRLTETQAPEGFWLPTNPDHTFTVADGGGSAGLVAKWDGDASAGVKAIENTPTKVVWEKVDSVDNKPLAGSTWTLKQGDTTLATVSDCVAESCETGLYKDQDGAAGKFMLKRLPAGTYKLQEATAPAGYQLSDTVYEFTIPKDEPNPAEVKVTANPIGNTRKPGEVTWEKIAQQSQRQHKQGQVDDPDTPAALSEEENHQLLAGSEWSLQYTPYQAASGTQPTTLTIKDCMPADSGSGTVNCTAANGSYLWAVDMEETAGKFKISGMPWGDYVLTESKAPDGYNLDTTPHAFSIGVKTSEDGSTVVGTGGTVTDGNTTISIYLGKIENEPGVVLPVTGAEGRHLWAAIVGALFVLAAFGCAVALRMRE